MNNSSHRPADDDALLPGLTINNDPLSLLYPLFLTTS